VKGPACSLRVLEPSLPFGIYPFPYFLMALYDKTDSRDSALLGKRFNCSMIQGRGNDHG
jgi:hypothetical protein